MDLETGEYVSSLVKPSCPITMNARQLTGITSELFSDCLEFNQHIQRIKEFIGNDDVLLIAHNGKKFDERVLKYHFTDNLSQFENCTLVDSLQMITKFNDDLPTVTRFSKKQQKLVEKKDKKLVSIYKHIFGSEIEDAHFALSDVKALALISVVRFSAHFCDAPKKHGMLPKLIYL
ncbi:predicted protein [Naegleria gruberi]|uniref:Predicted protein n=1 Tax=Naegleria gruberi TaxID=5762 RepID=D2V3S3_NAEGR|nr:uncharacterized protein NAEGRDRAFT_63470 [Naegleria gruberi]EFC48246.1 predicted protein [Naegleria gruberi]|eukprot:XP_002680990.1 predicted protein [Naegleria gruberi strain NEG-M]